MLHVMQILLQVLAQQTFELIYALLQDERFFSDPIVLSLHREFITTSYLFSIFLLIKLA